MLTARDFPPGTPLHHFFAWNERRRRPDRRYLLARDSARLPPALAALLAAAAGNPDIGAHAAVFAGFERSEAATTHAGPRHILVIRLSALGDFVQALGPFAAIRRHHHADRISLLTTGPLADFATELGCFDDVMVDERPQPRDFGGWLKLRRRLRQGGFDRVYDLQTSQRSNAYAWLLRPGMPEWSGVAWRCSHPHANLERDRQHTLDEQAEQLLMAGIYPTPLPALPPFNIRLPEKLADRNFAVLVPGSSSEHPEKRWPARRFGALAEALSSAGLVPVMVGTAPEAPLAAAIRGVCPAALDLAGQTDLKLLAALVQQARLTVGNDSGVSHLAAAAGCPVLVLFSGDTDPARHAPRGRRVRILAARDLGELTTTTVIAEAIDLAAAANSASDCRR